MTAIRPTKKQQELLVFIEAFIGEHGYSPSYREIMNGCQYTSVATVALHVNNLIKRGHIRKRDHSARSLEVVTHGDSDGAAGPEGAEALHIEWLVQRANLTLEGRRKDEDADIQADFALLEAAFRLLDLETVTERLKHDNQEETETDDE